MAKCLGKHLKDESYTRVYCSDLQRCRDTLENIISTMTTSIPEVQYTPLLRERDFGDWEFLHGKVVSDKMTEMNLPEYKTQCVDVPNGETYKECRKRAARFFSEILKVVDESNANEEENILAISHGILITCFIENLVENPAIYDVVNFNEDQLTHRINNTGRTRFSINKVEPGSNQKRRITFTHFFDTEHFKYMNE